MEINFSLVGEASPRTAAQETIGEADQRLSGQRHDNFRLLMKTTEFNWLDARSCWNNNS